MTYSEKLKDPRWQKKRLEILQRDEFTCKWCGDSDSTLHVHHIAYYDGDVWDTPNDLLITLCLNCHKYEESDLKSLKHEVFNNLRKRGFTSTSFSSLAYIFDKNRNWGSYEPAFDILAMVVEDDKLWNEMENEFWKRLNDKISNNG